MIRRILLPIDTCERPALMQYVRDLALQHDASVRALAVVDVRGIEASSVGAGPGASHYAQHLREHHLDNARRQLTEALQRVSDQLAEAGVRVESTFEIGSVTQQVIRHAILADLIVVAQKVNFRFETDDEPGGQLFKILRSRVRPTLVVPEVHRPINTAIVAHDMGLRCHRNLFSMLQLRPFPGAKVVVIHADTEATDDHTTSWAEEAVAYLQDHRIDGEVVIRNLEAVESIALVVEEQAADVVILGPFTKSTVERWIFGSVSSQLLDSLELPILFGI